MRQALWFLRDNGRLDGDFFRVCRFLSDITHTENRVAYFKIRYARTETTDYTGEIAPRNVRHISNRRVAACANFPVCSVDACSVYIDQHLAWSGNRIRHIAVFHNFRPAVFHEISCFHLPSLE